MTRILALDLATKTGWALWDGSRIESGVQDFTKRRGESNGMLFLKFNAWLNRVGLLIVPCHESAVDLIVFEQAHHRGGAATEIAVGLMTRILEFGARYGIEHTSVHSATLKKFATGRGNAEKEAMKVAANRFLREQHRMDIVEDDNEADAICLLCYAIETFGGGTSCNVPPAAAVGIESSEKLTPAR